MASFFAKALLRGLHKESSTIISTSVPCKVDDIRWESFLGLLLHLSLILPCLKTKSSRRWTRESNRRTWPLSKFQAWLVPSLVPWESAMTGVTTEVDGHQRLMQPYQCSWMAHRRNCALTPTVLKSLQKCLDGTPPMPTALALKDTHRSADSPVWTTRVFRVGDIPS